MKEPDSPQGHDRQDSPPDILPDLPVVYCKEQDARPVLYPCLIYLVKLVSRKTDEHRQDIQRYYLTRLESGEPVWCPLKHPEWVRHPPESATYCYQEPPDPPESILPVFHASLVDHVEQTLSIKTYVNDDLGCESAVGESRQEFELRMKDLAGEKLQAAKDELHHTYRRIMERYHEQMTQQRLNISGDSEESRFRDAERQLSMLESELSRLTRKTWLSDTLSVDEMQAPPLMITQDAYRETARALLREIVALEDQFRAMFQKIRQVDHPFHGYRLVTDLLYLAWCPENKVQLEGGLYEVD